MKGEKKNYAIAGVVSLVVISLLVFVSIGFNSNKITGKLSYSPYDNMETEAEIEEVRVYFLDYLSELKSTMDSELCSEEYAMMNEFESNNLSALQIGDSYGNIRIFEDKLADISTRCSSKSINYSNYKNRDLSKYSSVLDTFVAEMIASPEMDVKEYSFGFDKYVIVLDLDEMIKNPSYEDYVDELIVLRERILGFSVDSIDNIWHWEWAIVRYQNIVIFETLTDNELLSSEDRDYLRGIQNSIISLDIENMTIEDFEEIGFNLSRIRDDEYENMDELKEDLEYTREMSKKPEYDGIDWDAPDQYFIYLEIIAKEYINKIKGVLVQ